MLPIKKITLYSNGFTSFEREAVVEQKGAHSLDLFFKTQDLDEVLRSLSCSTSDSSAQVNSVSYQSTKNEEDDTIVDVGGGNSLTSLLRSLVGTRVEVTLDLENQKLIGSLVGVEDFTPPNATNNLQRTFVNIFTDGCSVKTLDLLQISNIKFLDENIRNSIQHALEAYLSQKNKDLQKVTIFTQGGEKAYTVKASYSLLAKEWLPTYRLTVDEKSNKSSLEVLAIVHNTQEEDWKDVNLTLISGSPAIPKAGGSGVASQGNMAVFIKRPGGGGTFTVRVNASDLVEVVKKKIQSIASDLRASSIALVFAGKRLEEGRTLHDYNIGADSTIHVTASNGSNGDDVPSTAPVFRLAECKNLSFFNIKTPVTVKRNQSALITILNSPLHTDKVLLFDPRQRKGNPLSSLMFQNTTGYTLEEGTVVIKQDNATIGEANLVQMWPKDEVMFPYAIELGVEVTTDINTDISKPHHIFIKDGEMRVYKYKTQTTTYSFDNKTDRSFDKVYIDHKFIDGWDLVETTEPVDITDATYRFECNVPAGKEKKVFKVKEKSVQIDTFYLNSISKSDMEKWRKAEILNKQVESDLIALIDIATQSSNISKDIYELETEVRECKSRQDTLRKNIEVLKDNKQQSKYVNELSAEDDKLTQLYAKIKQYTQAKQKMNQAHTEACNKVTHKYDVTYK